LDAVGAGETPVVPGVLLTYSKVDLLKKENFNIFRGKIINALHRDGYPAQGE
jgi:hypothetical protein